MKTLLKISIIFILSTACEKYELTDDLINDYDNAFVNSNMSKSFFDTLNPSLSGSYIHCLSTIREFQRIIDKGDSTEGGFYGFTGSENLNTFDETRSLFYFLPRIKMAKVKLDSYKYDPFLNKEILFIYYMTLNEYYNKAYKTDYEKKNIWIRIGLSIIMTDHRYYDKALEYLFEAQEINPDNNYIKELIVKNLLLNIDTHNEIDYLKSIPEDYEFIDLDESLRNSK